jgi:glycosyltransferase involved in cell wall biosynthesis
MRVSVLVPTYRRPTDLARCLDALKRQARAPYEVIVVARSDDQSSLEMQQGYLTELPLRSVFVTKPGQVAALNKGLEALQGEIVAFIDDDAAPHVDWIERIEARFQDDPSLGALGGRDFVYQEGQITETEKYNVGIVQWFGRTIGNHHLGIGPLRDVDFLKGVNMSYRREAIAGLKLDGRLRGNGAEAANDFGISLSVKKRGWRVAYDPAIAVDHYPSIRHDIDKRHQFNWSAKVDYTHNVTLVLLDYLSPFRRGIFMTWAFLVGDRTCPGVAQWVRFTIKGDRQISAKLSASICGRLEAWRTWRRSSRLQKCCRGQGRQADSPADSPL